MYIGEPHFTLKREGNNHAQRKQRVNKKTGPLKWLNNHARSLLDIKFTYSVMGYFYYKYAISYNLSHIPVLLFALQEQC